ncbi:uncharacterized protein EV420DRAFT_1482310 [Desarmillaria tabescens]|uniref:Uncharacterized protein n=1 Tax=Armillaria tabescens TaxID=1929756 RepID=A0AA39MYV9_ARMTA|nr:uncharacterized protein EV420DRAFT_1482310 [Desarmillaria tabescens]KAK0451966.1 hypothetical protein EV420DRAFT_1482310 [Desarmillaria tabescens]
MSTMRQTGTPALKNLWRTVALWMNAPTRLSSTGITGTSVSGESMRGLNTVMYSTKALSSKATHSMKSPQKQLNDTKMSTHATGTQAGLNFEKCRVMQTTNSLHETVWVSTQQNCTLSSRDTGDGRDQFGEAGAIQQYASQMRKLLDIGLWPLERVVMAVLKVFPHVYLPVRPKGRPADDRGVWGDYEGVGTIQDDTVLAVKRTQG